MASLRDKVVELTYRLKDQFTNQISRVTGGIRRIDEAAERSAAALERSNARAGGSFAAVSKAAKGLFAVLSLREIAQVGQRTLKTADDILKFSQRIGASTEALSQLRYVADLSGVSFNTLTMGLQRMTRRVAEAAQGTGEAKDALRELGLDAEKLTLQRPEEQFEAIAEAMLQVGNQSDKVRLAMKLFDSEGVALLQMMTRGAEGIREFREEADRAGVTLTEEMAEGAAEARDKMTALDASLSGLSQTLTLAAAPAIASMADQLNSEVSALRTFGEAIDKYFSSDEDLFALDLSAWELLTTNAADLRKKLDAIEKASAEWQKNTAAAGDAMRNSAADAGRVQAAYVDVRRETELAETALGGYIDKLGAAVQEADALKTASSDFVAEIEGLLNPRDASLTNVYADLQRANAALETGNLEEANRIFESLKGELRAIATEGDESAAAVGYWAEQIGNLGRRLAELSIRDEQLDFTKAEADLDRLTTKMQALQDVNVSVDVTVNDDNLQELLQVIEQVSGGASGSWEDVLDEADKRGT